MQGVDLFQYFTKWRVPKQHLGRDTGRHHLAQFHFSRFHAHVVYLRFDLFQNGELKSVRVPPISPDTYVVYTEILLLKTG